MIIKFIYGSDNLEKDKKEKLDDLDNFEVITQNSIAQAANIGTFAMGVQTINDFTQVNPSPFQADNLQEIKEEHTANFHEKRLFKT